MDVPSWMSRVTEMRSIYQVHGLPGDESQVGADGIRAREGGREGGREGEEEGVGYEGGEEEEEGTSHGGEEEQEVEANHGGGFEP